MSENGEPVPDGRGDTSNSEQQRLESALPPSLMLHSAQGHFTPRPKQNDAAPSPSRGTKRSKSAISPESNPSSPQSSDDENGQHESMQISSTAPSSVDPWVRDMLIQINKNVLGNKNIISDLESEISILKDQADNDKKKIIDLEDQIDLLTVSNSVLSSRQISLEKRMSRYESEQIDQKNRGMRDNIIFRTKGEDYKHTTDENTAAKVKSFINKELRIPVKESQEVQIHRAHRMGKPAGDRNAMMIAKIPRESDKKKIFSNVKALKDTNFSISTQCAPQTEERKMFAWSSHKAARKDKKETRFDHTGRLHIQGIHQTKFDPIKLPPSSNYLEGKIAQTPLCGHSSIQTINGHQFIAYAASVSSLQEVSDYRDFLHGTGVLKEADFVPHAFSFTDPVDGKLENFDSDGDHFCGLQILKALRDKKENGVCVFMVHMTEPSTLVAKVKNAAIDKVTAEALLSLKKAMQ